MDRETARRLAKEINQQAVARQAQRYAAIEASKARKQLANKGVKEDQYKYYREMDIGAEQKRLDDLRKQQEVFKGFESLVGMGGTLDTPIYDGDTPIYFKDYFADYDQSIDLSTMEGRKQAITPYDRTSDINKLSKELDIARLAQSVNLDAKEDFKTYSVANNKATKALQKERRDSYLTPEEKRRYYYLYNTQGEGAAESYMRALQADLYSRGMQKVYDFADDNGWAGALASVGSVATSLLSGFEGAANLAAYAADKYIGLNEDAELRRGYLSDLTQAMRGGASADMGAGGSFVYDTVMSGVDSFLASFVPVGAVTLGLSAASQASNDILSRGGTGEQALVGGVAAGLFEGFFENFSISKLKSMDPDEITTSWKSFGKNIGKQVATNAQEEAATEAANIIFDTVAMGDISNAVLSYDRYVAEGMSEEDAKAKVIRDMALQIGAATASGALIGGAFGVGGAGVGAVARAKQGRSIVNDKGTKLNDLIEAGEATFVGDQYKGERGLLEAVKANKSKNDVAQRNRVQKLDELLTKEAAERAKNAPTWAEQQKAMREATLKDVAGAVDKARGEAENAKIGKDITYTYMPSIANFSGAEGNSIFIEKSDGTTAKLSNLAVEDEELYEAYSLATSTGSVNNANAFIQNYRLHGNNVPVEEFWAAWIGVQNYGQTVTSDGAMEKAIAKYGTGNIPESALQAAFLSGRNMRTSTTEKYKATQEKYEKAWKDAGGKLTEARFNDNALKGKSLDKSQQEYRSFLRAFSRATGTNIEVFMSEKGARKENGSYNRDTNTLRIDINAGIRNNANYTAMESSIVNTLSHEVVHNMRVTAPELYDALSAFVTETLQADENYNLDEAIEAEIEKGKQKDRELSREDAIEEIVARACEDRLGSSEKLRDFMIEFYAKDEKAANGFIKAVKEFIARLKSFFENIAKQKSSSEEAQLIAKQSAETIAEIQKRFDEALLAMREGNTARNAVEQVNVSIDAATESASPIMLSETTWRESEYVTKTEQAAAALAKALDVSTEDALKYIKNVNSVAKMIANDRARLDYFASSFGSAFVSNVEYGGSFDFTTLCKKRRIYTGTFSEIQKRLGEVALTPDQILEIRNLLIAARYEAPCGLCYVEGSRANMGKFAKKFIELYKRDNPGAWIPKMVDVNTPDGVEQMHRMHPECYEQYEYFWNHYGKLKDSDPALFASQQKPKLYEARKAYKNEILELFKTDTNVTNKNRNGGIRMQSFSDFEIVHAIDTMQIIMDMSRVGLAGQAYTKVPEFAKAFGDTGLKINLSLIAKGVDENGKIIFDDREGMPHETAFNIRKKHSENVGTILVIFNDAQLYAAMADDRIDFIIPFHRSQWKKGQYAAMGLPAGTKDYTYMQNEKLIKPTYHEYQGRMVKDKASNYMPNAYWKFSKSGKENAEAYLKMCAENNKRPKFYKLLDYDGNGTYSLKKDGSTDGYWKLLVDFKMYDNEGNGSPQTPVRPDFSMTEIRKMLKEYEGGHASYPVAHDVVDKFVDMYKAQETAKSSTVLTQPVKVGASLGGTMLQERRSMTDEEKTVGDSVANFIDSVSSMLDRSRISKRKLKIGQVSTAHKNLIDKIMTSINPSFSSEGYEVWIDGTGANHISERHGKNGEHDHTMATREDKALIPWVVNSPDDGEFIKDNEGHVKLSNRFYNADGTKAPQIRLVKHIGDGVIYVSECVLDAKSKRVYITSAYKNSSTNQLLNIDSYESPQPTSETSFDGSATDNSILPSAGKVNTSFKKNQKMFQDRIETPEPSEVLRKYFAGNETYEGYKPYVESLKKYRDLMERVEVLDAKIDALNENIARLRSEHRQSGKGTRMDDLYKQKQNAEKRVEELRNRMFAMEAKELRRVVEAESKRVISDVRRAENERFAEKSRERRENASKRQYIESIAKRTKAISELFAKNNAEKHIPDELKAPIAELMTALDFSSKRSLSGGDMTQKEEKLKAAVKRITELSALTNGQGLPALDLPPRFQKEWDAVKEAISVHTWGKGTMYPSQMILEYMNSSDLRALNRSLMDIQHAINVANDVISQANAAPISALSGDLVRYLDNEVRQRKAQSDNLWQDTKNFLVWENTLPVYAFDRLGGTGRILFESFQNGFDQLVGEVNQIIDYTEKAYNTDEVKEWRKQVHSFECETLSGDSREIHLTVPQIMSFYCLSKREHAMPHFKGGGIVSEDIKAGKEKYKNDANGVRLTDETIVKILSTLTARQREVADKLQSFLNTECSAWGNEVSMKRYGIRMFTEQNYFPIRTKGSTIDISETNAPQNTKMYALLNMSFSKPLTELANNQIVISDIFEVFADHSNSMARYHSLALPVLDYMKVYNYREKIKSGDDTDTSYEQKNVRDSVKNAYGDAGLEYFEQFITGINGANWTQDSNKLSAALTKSAKTAMVGFNLRTVVQQPTSAVRALMYLGLDDMVISLNPAQIKKGHELAVKYCAMAKWKSMGYFDIGTGRGMERMLVGDETWKDKTVEASMYMAGKADELTLAYMWNACERWVSKHDKTLKKDTEEYYKAVGNKLREVIYRSQVVDSPLTRSKFMNSPSEFNKMLAMFGAEPTVTYNMALDVAYKIASAKSRKQAWGEQRRQIAGFIGIYATQALLLAAVQSAMDAIRDDDDEPYGDKYMDEFWANLLAELNPLNKLPILRDIVSALEGYVTSRIDTTLWSKLSYLFKDVEKLIKGKDVTLYKWVYDILSAASTATGVAASNLVRDIVALWNTIIGSFFPHLKIKK